jgi:phage tail sheath protein FI
MPEYLSPGVYIEEQNTGPEPIEGVSTSTTGFVGMTVRGPISGPPQLVTSFSEFTRLYGSFLPDTPLFHDYRYLPYAVRGFFDNLGQRAYIVRVPGKSNAAATDGGVLVGGLLTRLTADVTSGSAALKLASTRGIVKGTKITLSQLKNGITTTEAGLVVQTYDDSGNVTVAPVLANSYQSQYTTVITDEANPGTKCQVSAADPGAWGNQLGVQIRQSSRAFAQVSSVPNVTTILLNTTANFYAGALVEFNKGTSKVFKKVKSVVGSSIVITNALGAVTDLDPDGGFTVTTVRTCEFDVSASYAGVTEQFRYLSMDDQIPNYYGTVIDNGSSLLVMTTGAVGDHTTDTPFILPSAPDGLNLTMVGGTDGTAAPADSDIIGVDNGPNHRTGIQALTDIEDISIVAAPGLTSQNVQNALITHCETLKYRFAVLDPQPHGGSGDVPPTMTDIATQRALYDTKYAAIYYPRIVVYDPLSDSNITVPPSGNMAGIYARVDDTRGVWKAPANEVIGGIDAIEIKVNKGDQDELNPVNINVLRDFTAENRGLRVYGARCVTSLSEWKYINVRRLFIFLERSLDIGTQWAVFEPNDDKLWARLKQSVAAFLTTVWREGGLMGTKAEEAFFVKCDRTTMSQDDIDNGRLIMIVGVAPVYPAEFVIIRIGQWAGGSAVQEL